jgi:UDP-3-O-[3-hydroxymyristoyl] glucosamine N-acyltransferase
VIVHTSLASHVAARSAAIVTDDPYLYFARLTQWWRRHQRPARPAGVHPSAVIHAEAVVAEDAEIGPLCVVERGARIGAGTVLRSRVTVGEDCVIGQRCLLHSGVVIGADGFGFAPHQGRWEKIEQLGAVRVGDDVEIGANTCIDRGALDDTVVGDGVKLDNLIQIGHNVRIGAHTAMAGCVGVAGSAVIGEHCTVGGGAIVLGHLTLADHVHVSAASVVTRSIAKPGLYTGMFPIDENAKWEKNAATVKQLHGLRDRIKTLEQLLDKKTDQDGHP